MGQPSTLYKQRQHIQHCTLHITKVNLGISVGPWLACKAILAIEKLKNEACSCDNFSVLMESSWKW